MKRQLQAQPWLIFAGALLLTLLAVLLSARAIDQRRQAALAGAVDAAMARLDASLRSYESLLRSTRAHLEAAPRAGSAGFADFIGRLQLGEHFPGLRGMGVTQRLAGPDAARRLEAEVRAEGQPQYRVWADSGATPAFAVRWLAPLDSRNLSALGYDMSSEPVRRQAMELAASSGDVVLSGTVALKSDRAAPIAGFLLILPLYADRVVPAQPAARAAKLTGYVYGTLRAADFFATAFDAARDDFTVEIFEGGGSGGARLFDNLPGQPVTGLVTARSYNHAGRSWTLRFVSLPALDDDPLNQGLTASVAVVGLLLSAGLLWLALRQGQARLAAEQAAAAREAALGEEKRQRGVAESLSRVALQLGSENDAASAIQRVTDEAVRLTGAGFGAYFHNLPDASGHFGLYTLSGAPLAKFSHFPPLRATPLFAATFGGHTVRLADVTQSQLFGRNPPYNGMPPGHLPLTSYLAVCVKTRSGKVLGGLFLGHAEPDRFRAEHEQLVEGLAAQTGVVLDNVALLASERQARTEAEARQRLLDLVVQQSGDGIVVADAGGTLRVFNPAAERQHGAAFKEVAAPDWQAAYRLHTLDGAPLPLEQTPLFHALGGRHVSDARWRVHRPDGSWRVLAGTATPLKGEGGSSAGAMLIIRDETDRLHAEEERQRLIDALARSNRELDQFAYVASHDLKAPLRGIANLSQWVEDDLGPQLPEKVSGHLGMMRGRIHRLEALIDGILAYSRAGRKRTAAQPVPLADVLQDVLLLLDAPDGVVTATLPLPVLHGERSALQQVLLNLVGNALKHAAATVCAEAAKVTVAARLQGDYWRITVRDNGPGIAAQYHERIWGMFQTLQSRDRVEGTGIGLAVVRKIAEAHGGRAWVESAPGEGAAFHFTWPDRGPA